MGNRDAQLYNMENSKQSLLQIATITRTYHERTLQNRHNFALGSDLSASLTVHIIGQALGNYAGFVSPHAGRILLLLLFQLPP